MLIIGISHFSRLDEYLITTRNQSVEKGLRDAYGKIGFGQMQIYCVSNRFYRDKRDEPATTFAPYLELSGIAKVRGYCISIVAESQRRSSLFYLNDRIPALLSQMELWVQSGARTASEERRDALISVLDGIDRDVTVWASKLQGKRSS